MPSPVEPRGPDVPSAAEQPGPSLFVYGTLMFPAVLSVLMGRVPSMSPASAPGWRAARLRDRVYPGLVRCPAGDGDQQAAPGQVLHGLDAPERAVLDAFEGSAYQAGPLVLSHDRLALAYLWLDHAEVLADSWDAGWFAEQHLAAYVQRCMAWRAQLVNPPA